MSTKRSKKKLTLKKLQKGTIGYFFIFGMVAFLIVMSLTIVGGVPNVSFPEDGTEVKVVKFPAGNPNNTLQLRSMGFITLAPTPKPSSPFCTPGKGINTAPQIIIGFEPDLGKTVAANGQIKVWVNDDHVPMVAPNEQVNPTTGQITTPGDRAAKAPDNFLWEPALYIAPQTAEANGAPHFPNFIKGRFNNTPPAASNGVQGPPIDNPPPGSVPNSLGYDASYTTEYIWNIAQLNLAKGSHQLQFLIHDGDNHRGVKCMTLNIQ